MAVAYVGVTAPAVDTTNEYVVAVPGGVTEGDLMLMFINLVNVVAPQYPAGWLEVPRAYFSESQWGFTILSKIASASEPADYTLVYPASGIQAAGIVAFTSTIGSHLRVPIADTIWAEDPEGSGPYTRAWPQVEIDVAGMLAWFGSYSWASTATGSATERWDGAGSGVQRPYLMTGEGGPGLTPAAVASATLSSSFRNTTVAVIESDPSPYPGPQYIAADAFEGAVDGSQTVTLPNVIEAGDMLIAHLSIAAAKTPTTPDGWEAIGDATITGAKGMWTYQRIAVAEDAGDTLTITFTSGATRAALGVTVFRSLRGRELALEVVDSQANSASSTVTMPNVSTAYDNAMMLYLVTFAANVNLGSPLGPPIRYTGGDSGAGYQIRAYTRHTFAPGAYSYAPTVSSSVTQNVATLVIVELQPPRRQYMIGIGHDLAEDDLTAIVPQLQSPGVMYTRRLPSGNHNVWDEGAFVPLEWNVLSGSALYQALLPQFGLDAAKVVAVTIIARDEVWNWARFNGYAVKPLPGDDIVWERFFPQGTVIIIKELELIEVLV